MVLEKSRKKTKEKKVKKLREHSKWWYEDSFPVGIVDDNDKLIGVEAWRTEVYVTNKKSFYIAVYPVKYLYPARYMTEDIRKGWNYEIRAVDEYGEIFETYDYYIATGKYFKTLKEAKEKALEKASKIRFPRYPRYD